ncbi:flagellar protein FlgN [Pullulanibacillus sp. KACC 23026]|uniref:flagellar protein FlgN n=1 Tax=Pullulanibacillus sp. KACC 23026 TaxID=3028315 RepID=UPI0023B07FBD|nr:flagellar protein FlgN [Pullulanibacillus sp. KACC 23026]WEG11248.1 flagellar protein FlgN [Pullulanibacillus sp. KACC 23026]
MDTLKRLLLTLNAMVDAHTRVLELAQEKRALLIQGPIQDLQDLIVKENNCVVDIQNLEQERQLLVQEYMEQNRLSSLTYTLEDLLKHLKQQNVKDTFVTLAKQLRHLIKEITHLNESNQQLLQTSLSYIHYSIGILARREPAITYGPQSTNGYSSLLDAKV